MTNTKLVEKIRALFGDPNMTNDQVLERIAVLHDRAVNPAAPLLFMGAVDQSGKLYATTNVANKDAAQYAQQLNLLVTGVGEMQANFSKSMIAAQIEAAKQQGLQLAARANGSGGKK